MARGELPKYQAIADDLRRRVDVGELAPGDQLPSQQSMAAGYGVTVMTLRQALAVLERDGLVRTRRGSGTFVSDAPALSFGLDHLSSFAQEMAVQGVAVETEVIAVDTTPGGADVDEDRATLAADGDRPDVVTVLRRRSIAGRPVVVQRSTLPAALWRRLESVDLGRDSLYDSLARRAGTTVERATERFRAVGLDGRDAELLGVVAGTPCLESRRVSFSADGPFLVDRALLLGSASEVHAERTADALRLGYTTT